MKNYIKYLKENPSKLVLIVLITLFCISLNLIVNIPIISVWLSIGTAVFSIIVLLLINLQVWGEYKGIEGFSETVKQFFYGL